MKPLHIDFVERPPGCLPVAAHRRAILIAFAFLAALAGAALTLQCLQLERQLDETSQAIAHMRQEIVARTPQPKPPLLLSEQQVLAINVAIGQLNTPWPAMLDGFESVATPEIALLQIEPDNRRRLVKGLAEAKNHRGMVDYLAVLGSTAPFAKAMVTKQEINDKDSNRPLRFMFEALFDDQETSAAPPGHGRKVQ
jgi:hypothetical protein